MGCESCGKGGGVPAGCKNHGTCSTGGCSKLAVYDWLSNMELPGGVPPFEYAEIRFKNSRKEFFKVPTDLTLTTGDAVIVDSSPGYDVGLVSASGELARLQMEKKKVMPPGRDLKKVLRKASQPELEMWREARALEENTMQRARKIASALGLDMKISDVEYQGDKSKAIFYYTAEGRVDFRELIRKYAEAFRVRIEMRQIGARQEAARLGGIGSCGRELCCSTWLTDFRSVSTSAARYQQLALNAAKLAGQCGKLKCCLNYELDSYMDALKHFPKHHAKLKTSKGMALHLKTDIFKKILWYVYEDDSTNSPIPVHIDRVKEILALNDKSQYPDDLGAYNDLAPGVVADTGFSNVVGQDSLTRFDRPKNKKKRKKKGAPSDSQTRQGNAVSGEKSSNSKTEGNAQKKKPRRKGGGGQKRRENK